jgi:hypothetical protein
LGEPAIRGLNLFGNCDRLFGGGLRLVEFSFLSGLHAGLERIVIFRVQIRRSFTGAQAGFEIGSFRGTTGRTQIGKMLLEALLRGLVFVLRII